jgi:hypothetical protein
MNKKTLQLLEEIREFPPNCSHPISQNFWIETIIEKIKQEARTHKKELRRRFHRRFNQRPFRFNLSNNADLEEKFED